MEVGRGRLALGCLIVLLALSSWVLCDRFTHRAFDTSLASLIPAELAPELPDDIEDALRARLSQDEAGNVIVLLRVKGETAAAAEKLREFAETAQAAVRNVLLASPALSERSAEHFGAGAVPKIPHAAGRLLSDADRSALRSLISLPEPSRSERLTERAVSCLTSAVSLRILGFANDPFCTYDHWLTEELKRLPWRASSNNDRTELELKTVPSGETVRVLFFTADENLAAAGKAHFAQTLEDAQNAAQDAVGHKASVQIEAAGVPLFTDAIAARAQRELTFIGTLSTISVFALAWALFGSPVVLLLMAATILLGFTLALGTAFAVFGTLSLITFVFGATLIGVSIDYSSHWFALKTAGESAQARRRRMAGALLSAALSTAAAYCTLALTPLPGLRQMAVLAACGVVGTLFTVLTVLPRLERWVPKDQTRLMRLIAQALPKLPRLDASALRRPAVLFCLALFAAALLFGLTRMQFDAGIRDLQGAPPKLLESQLAVSRALALPSPAQAFVLQGPTLSETLEHEEALLSAMEAIPELKSLTPSGLSMLLPSDAKQDADRDLVAEATAAAAPRLLELLGASPKAPDVQRMALNDLESTPWRELTHRFVLENEPGRAVTVLMLAGVEPKHLPFLTKAAEAVPGAYFVDITRGMSEGLSLYRDLILIVLAAGIVLLWALLTLRFGRESWRAVLPSALGILAALAVFGWTGTPVTIFTALGLVLVLGLGVDYGIFLTGSPNDGRTSAAVLFSGVTTLLSFGLLVFSATPALRAFGITVLAGQSIVWAVTPLLRPAADKR